MKKLKILNLYGGLGGNRKLWGNEHEVTTVENNENILKIYKDFFPDDFIICGDAHQYLLEHFEEFDFIWSSPPCPSHSHIRLELAVASGQNKPLFPDMKLYEEIIFLKFYFKGKWVVENVVSYYDPLIPPQYIAHHYFWSNFLIPDIQVESRDHMGTVESLQKRKGFDLSKYSGIDKRKALRNCVEPEVGKLILKYALNPIKLQKEINF